MRKTILQMFKTQLTSAYVEKRDNFGREKELFKTRSENKTYIWLWNCILSLNGIGLQKEENNSY